MTNPALLNAHGVSILKSRRSLRYEQKLGPESRLGKDYDMLLAFAEHVLVNIGLDISHAGAAFDTEYAETSCEDEGQVMMDKAIGDEASIYFGYYTEVRRYRLVPVLPDGTHCDQCEGKGCDDWAGPDCPSGEVKPKLLRTIAAEAEARRQAKAAEDAKQ